MKLCIKKKELKRIDWDIVKRILFLLYGENKIKKTHIAMKCNLNYDQTILYLNWLEMIGFIKKINNECDSEMVILSDNGMNFCAAKLNDDNIKVRTAHKKWNY